MIEAIKPVAALAIAAGILMLLVLGFSGLRRRFPRAMRVFAQVQWVAFLVAIGIGLDRAYRGVNFDMPAIVAIYLACTLTLTALVMRRT
jgi:putative Mn2+ efflux pump MntP